MSGFGNEGAASRATPGYLVTLALACVGLPFLGIGLGGALIGGAGGDPIRAFDTDGMVLFLLAFAVAFASRLIFWPAAPPALRQAVRTLITVIFALSIPLSLLGLVLALHLPSAIRHASSPTIFSFLALLCQISTALWLVRYRNEGL